MITVTEVYVAGLTQTNASALIGRAHELGLPASVVRTVDGGFIVPAVLVEQRKERTPTTPTPARRKYTRKSTRKPKSATDTTADAVTSEE